MLKQLCLLNHQDLWYPTLFTNNQIYIGWIRKEDLTRGRPPKYLIVAILVFMMPVHHLIQWFPTTAQGITSAPRAALKCSPKFLKSTILKAKN